MSWQETIIAAHLAVTDAVSHAERIKSERYFCWQENGADDLTADNIHSETSMSGSTDFFTKIEIDPWAAELGEAFDAAGIIWNLNGVNYEPDTGFFHYDWDWTVI